MQEALSLLLSVIDHPLPVYLCVDNQNALLALSGGPPSNREYLGKCQERVNKLQCLGCNVKGKWTPSHCNIPGNEQADILAKKAESLNFCSYTCTTLRYVSLAL